MDKINEDKAKDNLIKILFPNFPTTDKEVEEFENNNHIESFEIPEDLLDPIKILKNGKKYLGS